MTGDAGMQQWKPYPAYKDSGVEWLGQVPEGWEVRRLKFAVTNINQKCAEDEIDAPFVALEHIESWTGKLYLDEDSKSDGLPNRYNANDVLFCKLRPYLAKIHLAKAPGICTAELLVLRSEPKTIPEYLYRFLLSRDVIDRITASTYGAKMPRANWEFVSNLSLLIPLEKEQQSIAAFLDHECARIDALIAKKRLLLELLEEKRRAVITQAVTRGLDPHAPMKDSGVEWLGQVPEGWEHTKIKYISQVIGGGTPSKEKREYWQDGTIPWVSPKDMKVSLIVDSEDHITEDAVYESATNFISPGMPLIVVRSGILRHTLPVAIAGCRLTINQDMKAFFLSKSVFSSYFVYWIAGYNNELLLEWGQIGATVESVDVPRMMDSFFFYPPLPEQQAIAAYLDTATAAIDAQRQAHEKSIALLQEYRASLIAHAVTGKIDVRGYAPRQEA